MLILNIEIIMTPSRIRPSDPPDFQRRRVRQINLYRIAAAAAGGVYVSRSAIRNNCIAETRHGQAGVTRAHRRAGTDAEAGPLRLLA